VSLAILVPVLNRPHRVEPLLRSIAEATTGPYRVVFLSDQGDTAEQDAITEAGVAFRVHNIICGGSYARKINIGVGLVTEPLVFFGADDLDFKPGWLEAAKRRTAEGTQVVGVNDLIRRRRDHTTHFLVTREYAKLPTIDGQTGPMHEGYSHWHVDDEFIATAKHRGVYAYARDSHVEHLHPMNDKAPDDDTYRRGRAMARRDRKRFRVREALWT
jgi:glycosyltransferase involved in cell wall biosynthesis